MHDAQAADARADIEALSMERLKLQGQLSQLVDREVHVYACLHGCV